MPQIDTWFVKRYLSITHPIIDCLPISAQKQVTVTCCFSSIFFPNVSYQSTNRWWWWRFGSKEQVIGVASRSVLFTKAQRFKARQYSRSRYGPIDCANQISLHGSIRIHTDIVGDRYVTFCEIPTVKFQESFPLMCLLLITWVWSPCSVCHAADRLEVSLFNTIHSPISLR